jgi:hypothetical protein
MSPKASRSQWRPGKPIVAGAGQREYSLLSYCGIRTDFVDYTVDRNTSRENTCPEQTFRPEPWHESESKPIRLNGLGWQCPAVPTQNSVSQRKPRDCCVAAIPSWA